MLFTSFLCTFGLLLFQDTAAPPRTPAKTQQPLVKVANLPGTWGESVRYRVSMDTKESQWHVWMGVQLTKAEKFEVWIPRWTPGGYHLADFAQYVDELVAQDDAGNILKVEETEDPKHWVIDPGKSTKIFIYYIANHSSPNGFAMDALEMEANRIKEKHAFINSTSLFAFVPGMLDRPTEVMLDLPKDWKSACALPKNKDGVYLAPNYYRLEDSPFLMSPSLEVITYKVDNIPHEVACVGRSGDELKELAEKCEKITIAGKRIMGSLPYNRYVFLLGFLEESGGGGLEHADSTLILLNSSMIGDDVVIHVLAHEFFHLWNAERIRVNSIHKPDYTKALNTGTIWMNEGATEYMSFPLLHLSGLMTEKDVYKELSKKNADIHTQKKISAKKSIVDFSRKWSSSKLGGLSGMMEIQFGVYERGAVTSFALDLLLRAQTKGEKGLTDVFRYIMIHFADKDKGYGEDELVEIIKKSTGVDVTDFYNKYVAGTELPDLDPLLAPLGLTMVKSKKGRPAAGGFNDLENVTDDQKALRAKFLNAGAAK